MKREIQVGSLTVHDKNCIGCKYHKKDIMISYTDKETELTDYTIIDLFLTEEQAVFLQKQLAIKLKENKNNE